MPAYTHDYRESTRDKIDRLPDFQREVIKKKINQICENPHHYKPLKHPMDGYRRVHILNSFVLIFSIDETKKVVIIEEYEHHDKVYR